MELFGSHITAEIATLERSGVDYRPSFFCRQAKFFVWRQDIFIGRSEAVAGRLPGTNPRRCRAASACRHPGVAGKLPAADSLPTGKRRYLGPFMYFTTRAPAIWYALTAVFRTPPGMAWRGKTCLSAVRAAADCCSENAGSICRRSRGPETRGGIPPAPGESPRPRLTGARSSRRSATPRCWRRRRCGRPNTAANRYRRPGRRCDGRAGPVISRYPLAAQKEHDLGIAQPAPGTPVPAGCATGRPPTRFRRLSSRSDR